MSKPTDYIHHQTSTSTVLCGARVSPWYDQGVWRYDGLDLSHLSRFGGAPQVTCPDCKAKVQR